MKEKLGIQNIVIVGMILVVAFSRLMIHIPNFSPIAAMGLFGAAYFSKKYLAFVIPFMGLFLSNLFLNNVIYAQYFDRFMLFGPSDLYVYGAFAIVILLGFGLLKKVNLVNVIGASLVASIVFFLITNFSSFIALPVYPKNIGGLISAYVAGIPFFKYTILGDLVFVGVLFGGFALIRNTYFSKSIA